MTKTSFEDDGAIVAPSNGNKNAAGDFSESPAAIDKQLMPRVAADMPEVFISMHSGLFEHARQMALSSGALKPNDNHITALTEMAETAAQEAYREEYDAGKFRQDALRDERYEKNKADLEEVEIAEKYAAAEVAEREEEVAEKQPTKSAPLRPTVVMTAAVVVIIIATAPTLHDFIFITMESDEFNWLASVVSAGFLGVFITWGILGDTATVGTRTVANWSGLIAGIVVGLGLGLLRTAHADGSGEILFALALTIVDLGIVLLLEFTAGSKRAAQQEYEAENATSTMAKAKLDMARAKLTRCQEHVTKLVASINKHIEYVELRSIRRHNIEDIKAAAIKSALNGYQAGVAENRGRVRGAKEKWHEHKDHAA